MIPLETLLDKGGQIARFKKGEFLFLKGDRAKYYYQVVSGEVKMNNFNDEGKEFIQGIFKDGRSFGEPPLFIDRVYPANAQAIKDSEILLLPKKFFFELLANPVTCNELMNVFARRLYFKAMMAEEISLEDPEHRILCLLDYFKKYTLKNVSSNKRSKIDLTRQEIANLTGLRVETTIRVIKSLEAKGRIKLLDRKIHV
ncbi:MAG: Crp/Fnr family transcriptional regulator [Xanthomarina gelatinilytica]|uniref:Crp/Fnr family transcriptional regulator n=1 Tax=Xanthomarina gelatinilytica TaxID=1137281 RepID=UPI003A84C368